ncbi:acetyltransferase (GNAT) family protein [Breoghania corrubedonensis]|uniref:Acetyltransferase (GNAT) family protein n=1 Tax=Breoghania corrubedonensis TaxID=665038 RepID=A0A2T5VEY4_9HYPH|nr:GNAT family N-acetyltransferase [Breoghania corrubedonensis]PTW62319.1 acetyltransferase (GNAT) family protein [Breoghania corrubedonensis]
MTRPAVPGPSSRPIISSLPAATMEDRLGEFVDLLKACVDAGASVNFIVPFSVGEAAAYWRGKILPGLGAGKRVMLAVDVEGRLAGTVNLDLDTPPNQTHRAEVSKLLVHPDFRRRGIARMLMEAVEDHAHQGGRTLLTLDTRTGDTAEPLYTSMGYVTVGVIPDYCRDADGKGLSGTTIMYKTI